MQFIPKMGNQRQLLKDNIEKELVSKIEAAKEVLFQLNKNLEVSKQNSLFAKEEIQTTAEVMKDVLIERKEELVKEVDNLHNVQARLLQDAMRSTYITMGRLQSMLTNLDSFDQSQLVELKIPQVSLAHAISEPTQISVSLECDQLKEDLSEWGSVTTDGFQCCLFEKASMKIPVSSFSGTCTPPVEEAHTALSSCANKENQTVPQKITAVCESCPWKSWGIEKWLRGSSSRKFSVDSSNIKDDFLIVPSPCSESSDMEFVVTSSGIDSSFDQVEQEHEDIKSGSSIICVSEKDVDGSVTSDLSDWLKPRKLPESTPLQNSNISVSPSMKYNEVVLSSDASNFLATKKRSVSLTEKRTLDFPCLRMETDNWVQKNKVKSTNSISKHGNSFLSNEQKLTPPAYALPNPFWLKKYQLHR